MASSVGDHSPEANGTGNSNRSKRKSDDATGNGQGRAKRKRYISIACNECKRRKIKCNGQVPCQRCGNLDLDCIYAPNCCAASFKDSEEYRRMSHQIGNLQEQVETLFANLNSLRSELTAVSRQQPRLHLQNHDQQIDPSLQQHSLQPLSRHASHDEARSLSTPAQTHSRPRRPPSPGPINSQYTLGIVKNGLHSIGISSNDDAMAGASTTGDVTPLETTPPKSPLHPSKDPIWHVSREEALRLVRIYQDEMHDMYPVVHIAAVIDHTNSVYNYMEAALRNGFVQPRMPGSDAIDDERTNLLKLILSIALVVEGSGKSDLGTAIYRYVQPSVDALLLGHAGFKGVRMLCLAAMYEFHCDNESRSWRFIGLTVRLCIELGLHRKETLDALPEDERNSLVLLFWAIYCLDRRWSFGTGMPFALQDSDIDPNLPKPDDKSPCLKSMVAHFGIASKVWHAMGSDPSKQNVSKEEVDYLDFQVMNWQRNLPDHLRYEPSPSGHGNPNVTLTPGQHRLQVILYLRANALRILIYRPVLHSVTSILNNKQQAQMVVDVAKDSIRTLTMINQISKMYRTSQSLFNAFLTSALAALFLAVSHAPAAFAEQVREEFHMALDLVRGFSKDSWVSKRLWRAIRVLKEVGPKLGLVVKKKPSTSTAHTPSQHHMQLQARHDEDPSRSAAVAMAGLAGHNVDEAALYASGTSWPVGSTSSNSPDGMVHDLSDLFEAAGGFGTGNGYNGLDGINSSYSMDHGGEGARPLLEMVGFGSEDELSRIMRDLF